jgi:hypothetical protein
MTEHFTGVGSEVLELACELVDSVIALRETSSISICKILSK